MWRIQVRVRRGGLVDRWAPTLVAVPITAVSFVLLSRFGFLAELPAWRLLAVLGGACSAGMLAYTLWGEACSTAQLWARSVITVSAAGAVVYATGWGPALGGVGFAFAAAQSMRAGGSRSAVPVGVASVVALAAGQAAIAADVAPSLIEEPEVHGLAGLAVMGSLLTMAFYAAASRRAERDQAKALESERRFRTFVEHSPDGVVVIDGGGRIVAVNVQLERLFGYHRDELLGKAVEVLLPERFRAAHEEHRAGYASAPRVRPMGVGLDLWSRRADGSEFPVDVSIAPLETEEGLLFTASVRDVTERRRIEEARDEFIANAAHELRTPLTALIGLASSIAVHAGELDPAELAEAREALGRQSRRARALVDNLLDLARLETQAVRPEVKPVVVAEAVERVLEVLPAPEGVSVAVEVPPDLAVLGTPVHLDQLLTNLLDNAYRHGGPHVEVRAVSGDGWVEVSVSDDGPGVPPSLARHVFEPFRRGDEVGRSSGSGLGLTVCRRIAEVLGGRLTYEPAEPKGARFTLRLPAPS